MTAMREKIRKLLAKGHGSNNENEAAIFLAKARELMLEHGITDVGEDPEDIKVVMGDWMAGIYRQPWHFQVAKAVSLLYGSSHLFAIDKSGLHKFAGMAHQIEASEETFVSICDQIEGFYKIALRAFDKRLSKAQRAELRASFKDAAATRVTVRVAKILNDRKGDSRALVVVDTAKEKTKAMLDAAGTVRRNAPALREGFGTGAGFNAGGLVRLQKEVKGSRGINRADERLEARAAANYLDEERRAFLNGYDRGFNDLPFEDEVSGDDVEWPNAYGAGYNEGQGDR